MCINFSVYNNLSSDEKDIICSKIKKETVSYFIENETKFNYFYLKLLIDKGLLK